MELLITQVGGIKYLFGVSVLPKLDSVYRVTTDGVYNLVEQLFIFDSSSE